MHTALLPEQLCVTVDILALRVDGGRLHLLLFQRSAPPYQGCWALPGRFMEAGESAEAAAQALLNEMLPRQNAFTEQLYTFTDLNRDPRGRVISIAYLAILPPGSGQEAPLPDEPPWAWCAVEWKGEGLLLSCGDGKRLTPGDLAFDHEKIIETGVRRLQGKIDYTDIGFHFLTDPAHFSLSELQDVFQAVLNRPLDTSNFRRAILNRYEESGRITPTNQAEKRGRGRPAALYRFNP